MKKSKPMIKNESFEKKLAEYREGFRKELIWFRNGERDIETLLDEIIATIAVEHEEEADKKIPLIL